MNGDCCQKAEDSLVLLKELERLDTEIGRVLELLGLAVASAPVIETAYMGTTMGKDLNHALFLVLSQQHRVSEIRLMLIAMLDQIGGGQVGTPTTLSPNTTFSPAPEVRIDELRKAVEELAGQIRQR